MWTKLRDSATVNTWLSLFVRVGGMAALLPLVLTHFDVGEVLVWQLFSTILMMVIWIDFGMSPTFSRFIAMAKGGATINKLRQVDPNLCQATNASELVKVDLSALTGTLIRINLLMTIVGTLIVGGVGTAVLIGPIAGLEHPAEGWSAWIATTIAIPALLLNSVNSTIMIGTNRITSLRRIETIVGLLQFLTNCAVVLLAESIFMVAVSNTFWSIAAYSICSRYAAQALRVEGVKKPAYAGVYFSLAWSTAWRSGVGVLFSTALIQGSGLLMPQLASTETAASYLLILRLITLASQISQAPFYSRLPSMSELWTSGKTAETIIQAGEGMRLSLWVLVISMAGLLFFIPSILFMIGSSVQFPNLTLAIVMCLAFFSERYGAMHMQLYTLSNHVIWHRVNGLTGVAMIAIGVAIWPLLGAIALPLAMLSAYMLILGPYISTKSIALLAVERWNFEKRTALLPFVALMACLSVATLVAGLR